jgi:gas vesicle protein
LKEAAADLFEKGKQKVGISSANTTYDTSTGYNDSGNYFDNTQSDDSMSGSNILLGALIVSVASAIVWSFATEKGNQTRRSIAKSSRNIAGNLKDKVTDIASDIANTVSDTYQTAKEGVVDMIEKEKQM